MRLPIFVLLTCCSIRAQVATTTTLSSLSPAAPHFGQVVTLIATVTPSSARGAVSFMDRGILVGSGTLDASGTAQSKTLTLPAGPHSLRAVYGGATGSYLPSQSAAQSYSVAPVLSGAFADPVTYQVGTNPASVAVGDFNGDGKADLVVVNPDVSVLLGNGDGTFQAAVHYPIANGSLTWVAVGDFNGDGKADLAVTRNYPGSLNLVVLLGKGDGTFQAAISYPVPESPWSVAVGDFNGDGKADLVVGLQVGVTVLLGNGNGTFQAGALNPVAANSVVVAVADFNGDGKPDLAVGEGGHAYVSVLLGNGDATFQTPTHYNVQAPAVSLVVGDFNGDGVPDLAAQQSIGGVTVLLGNANGTMQAAVSYGGASSIGSVVVADFNGDGKTDVAVTDRNNEYLDVLLGNGNGTFQTPYLNYPFTVGVHVMAVGDFNGDGRADLAVTNESRFGSVDTINVLLATPAPPTLTVSVSHQGNFTQGQLGASYTINVTNQGPGSTDGSTVTISEQPGTMLLRVTSMVGTGWACPTGGTTCTRSDVLASGGSYPPIVAKVNVAGNTASPQYNDVGVFGGGSATTYMRDNTIINAAVDNQAPTLTITSPLNGATVATNIITVSGTASDLGLGNSGISSVTVNGTAANNGSVFGSDTAPWTAQIALNQGLNTITVVAKDWNSNLNMTTQQIMVTYTPPGPGLKFVTVAPCRFADTRNANGPFGGPAIAGGNSRSFAVPNSVCGIPASAAAYSINVTVVPHGSLGYLTAYPASQALPLVSTLNSLDGRVKANGAIVPAGAGGAISVFASDTTDVILDINGYFVAASSSSTLTFFPLTPCRVADTRSNAGTFGRPFLAGGQPRSFPIRSSSCNAPATAQAYSLNFTAVPHGKLGYITTFPTGGSVPLGSTLNAITGKVTANAAIVTAGANGAISVFASDDTDLVIDIDGYFALSGAGGLSLYSVTPCRVLDTRNPSGSPPFGGAMNVNTATSLCPPPPTAQAYVFSATVVPSGLLGYLSLWPQGQGQPLVSTLNALDGAISSNMAIVPTTNGSIISFASDATYLILDISAYFAP